MIVDETDDDYFVYTLKQALEYLDISNRELADKMGVSTPTIERWKIGKNMPRSATRASAFKFLHEKIGQKYIQTKYCVKQQK